MKKFFPERLESFLEGHRGIILLLIFLCIASLYLSTASDQLGGNLGGDNARYIMLARALASGQGYRDTYLPGEPPHTKYPFLFSAMLAPLTFLEEHELLAMHLFIGIMAVLIPFFIYAWMRVGKFGITVSLALLILTATIPRFFSFILHILSEVPFMFFLYLAFFLLARLRSRSQAVSMREFTALTIISLLAVFTRTIGFCLIAAVFLEMILDPRFRKARWLRLPWPAIYLICFGAAFSAWSARNHIVGGSASVYLSELILQDPSQPSLGYISFFGLISRSLGQALEWIPRIGMFFDWMPWMAPVKAKWIQVTGFIFFLFMLYGLAIQFRKKQMAEALFFALYLIVICAWPFDEDRFCLPLLPLALVYFFIGTYHLSMLVFSRITSPRIALIVVASIWAVIFLYQAAALGRVETRIQTPLLRPDRAYEIKGYGTFKEPIVDWARYELPGYSEEVLSYLTSYLLLNKIADEILPEDAVILTRKPAITAFFSGRKATRFLFTTDSFLQWEHISREKAGYIITFIPNPFLNEFVRQNRRHLKPLLQAEAPELMLIQISSFPSFVFRGDKT